MTARALAALVVLGSLSAVDAGSAQTLAQRGFVDARVTAFARDASNDPTRAVGDLLAREDVVSKPARWIQFAVGVDARINSHDQVDRRWRVDFGDRGLQRPALSIRRMSATFTRGPLTVDAGKQVLRWGKADIVTPTDRFAPRDFLNVVDSEFLAVTGVRAAWLAGSDTVEGAWVPRITPSRIPLLKQRWTAVPSSVEPVRFVDVSSALPEGSQAGVRWSHVGGGYEYSASYFQGFNHLPNISIAPSFVAGEVLIVRTYPRIRSYGGDVAIPTPWFTVKAEAAGVTSSTPGTDEYVLYVAQVERQTGEWLFLVGYAGEIVTARRSPFAFSPDRGLTRSLVGRVSYTIDTNRSAAIETAVRQNGHGAT